MVRQSVRFEDFQDTLMQHLPGALPDSVRQTFFTHARRFYKRTRAWRDTIEGLLVSDCTNIISLSPIDQYGDVAYLEAASIGGAPMRLAEGPDTWASTGRPSRIWLPNPHEAHVWPTPTEQIKEPITLTLSMQPRRDANHLPPEALTHHYEALVSGVLGDMLAQQKKPYTDGALSALHSRRFETEISRTIAARVRGYVERSHGAIYPLVSLR